MRLPREGTEPPAWALRLLDKLGRYIFSSGGITAEELALMKATSTQEVLTELANRLPALVTDPAR